MKLIALLSVLLSFSAFSTVPTPACNQFKGDLKLYKACVNGEMDGERYVGPIVMLFCAELHEPGTPEYEECLDGSDLTNGIQKNWKPDPQYCMEMYGYGTDDFNACMNGTLDEFGMTDKSLPMNQCIKICSQAYDFDLCYEQICQGPF